MVASSIYDIIFADLHIVDLPILSRSIVSSLGVRGGFI